MKAPQVGWSTLGKPLGAFGKNGRMPGELSFAHHLPVGRAGNVYAAEIKNQRVQKFEPLH
jgi:hypothetical protein